MADELRAALERLLAGRERGRRGSLRGHDDDGGVPEPTDALPGTPEKKRVLEERAAKGQQLFHEDDATLNITPGRGRPWASARAWPQSGR